MDSDPVFSPDGRYLIYSSDVNRVYNLYAYRLEDGAVFQVTNLLTGAFQPTFSHDKERIIFVGYDETGYNLYQVSYDPSAWKRVELEREPLPAFKPAEAAGGEPYNPFPYLRPLYWLPMAGVGVDGFGLGVSFAASDPVGLHAYSVGAGFDSSLRGCSTTWPTGTPGWASRWSCRRWGPAGTAPRASPPRSGRRRAAWACSTCARTCSSPPSTPTRTP